MNNQQEDAASSESANELVPAADSTLSVPKNGDSSSENGIDGDRVSESVNGRRSGSSESVQEIDPVDMVKIL